MAAFCTHPLHTRMSGGGLAGVRTAAIHHFAHQNVRFGVCSKESTGRFSSIGARTFGYRPNNAEELKRYTQSLVEQSPTLSCPGAENRTKRDLFEALRRELEGPVLERAAKATWDLIHSKEGLGKEIADTVDAVYHKLVGQESNQAEMRTPSQDNLPKANGQAASYSYPSGSRSMEDRGDQVMDRAEPIRKRRGYSDS